MKVEPNGVNGFADKGLNLLVGIEAHTSAMKANIYIYGWW